MEWYMWLALLSPFYVFMTLVAYMVVKIERDLREYLTTPAAMQFFKAVVNEKNVEAVGKEVNVIVERLVGRFGNVLARLG